ncbi:MULTISPECIES: efflux RND transporter periplasmic adaptor subunit [Stenotrophomonas]|uniref:efflux RND transporter periplasmic adaptor subunit n=1 Tax=Stenotrophomonas TaxID=40323 RepID=UPI00089DF695|nr:MULTISPECIES: efflux RND transporter periplasmic adaptor subunit [Stenotrophomonas]AOX63763.1 efflux transporter periplasmic adaptor subunit [Stenotrophomonas sp. LM091]MCX2919894.1 efflux RND transporter periplasmic adaptor subunit [Stenotrophomonas rhizophila]MDX5515587.1 efflux RND transporter periplasmic adaptor subunit [Stenotrophomonas sp. RG-453]OFS97479.1 efflux transporter periplasmic adaptor subunit [Stenotrophomonas sp. HMSC10F06]
MTSNSSPQRFTRRLAMAGVSILAAAVLTACSGSHAEEAGMPPPPSVSAAPVLVKQVSQWDDFSGRVEAVESVELRPRVSGYIDKVNYVEGQEVKKGDVLFTIDARSYRAELDRATAELNRARTQAQVSRSEADRARRLSDQQAISTETWEQRRAVSEQALAQVQAAQAAVDAARLNMEFTQVRAPINGRAGRAMVTAGNLVTAGDSASVLTTLVSLDKVHVYFDADEGTFLRYAQMARKGERPSERDSELPVKVGLSGENGFPHEGKVDFLDNQVTRSTGTIRVRALLDNADRAFTPGLFARVQLLGSGQFQAMLIDEKAVLTDQDRKFVYVVDKDNKAQRRDIELGRNADGLRIVEQGLKAGDRVIVDGVQKVFMPGMPVQAKAVAMQPVAAPVAAPAVAKN